MSPRPEWLNLPNKITIARLVIAVLLFVLFSLQIHWEVGDRSVVLNLAAIVFSICVATDWLDGYLARRWGMVTTFGRIADPFVDKVVVCGSFVYLVKLVPNIVWPSVAVVIIAREFLVTGLRSYLESQGVPFGARWGGKIKMVVQSFAIPALLVYEANYAHLDSRPWMGELFHWGSIGLVIATLISTIISAWDYIAIAVTGIRESPREASVE
ncbi:MAG: CDP-diacylglycerol--glycerol-3-phosphate 3-phosphatidyltransferase [Planctomycetes bacterium]|nr:CDP-diacylglycerol--glycerol-3-phosphate 3-phosphatidyltransferase [Planctomycetota bacterium]